MSPEQARGHAVDKRTDIWAFGCVLYEMLSGQRPFGGETMSDTFVGILEREPDWSALPVETPASIRMLLERCLRKDPRKRLRDIADAFIDIDEYDQVLSSPEGAGVSPVVVQRRHRERLGWVMAVFLGVAFMGTVIVLVLQVRRPQPAADPVQFTIGAPDNWLLAGDAFTGACAQLRNFSRRPTRRGRRVLAGTVDVVGPVDNHAPMAPTRGNGRRE